MDFALTDAFVAEVARRVGEAQGRYPDVVVDPTIFARYLADRLRPDRSPSDAIATMHVSDLYLACACVLGNRAAIAHLDRDFFSKIGSYVAARSVSRDLAQEVAQQLRMKLLMRGNDGNLGIESYQGRGALGAWLRLAAVRRARDAMRAARRQLPPGPDGPPVCVPRGDAELTYLRRRYRPQLRAAFETVLSALPAKDRNVLRWHFFDGLSTNAIGKLVHVDGSTIRRTLARLRAQIIEETHRRLAETLDASPSELRSLLTLLRSEVDVSVVRYLK